MLQPEHDRSEQKLLKMWSVSYIIHIAIPIWYRTLSKLFSGTYKDVGQEVILGLLQTTEYVSNAAGL